MAQQSVRRGRKNQMYSSCLEHAFMIWFRSANSHTGPQLHRCTIRGRTDGSIRLRADLLQKSLASHGASTDEYTRDDASIMRTRPSRAPLIWTKSAPAFAALSPSMGQVYFNIATASIIANDK